MTITKEQFEKFVNEYIKHNESIAKHKREQDFIKPLLKGFMDENCEERMITDDYAVILSRYTKKSLNKSLVKELLKEKYDMVVEEKEVETLRVSTKLAYDNTCRMLNKGENKND